MLCGIPKVRRKMKKHSFFKKNVDDTDVYKTYPLDAFFGHGCIAIHVVSDPPPPPELLVRYIDN